METIPTLDLDHRNIEDMIYGTVKSRLLLAAIELKIFDILATAGSAREVSVKLGTHPQNTRLLLRALAACGLLEHNGKVYKNSPEARAFLDSKSPACITQWLVQAAQMFDPILGNLKRLIINGPGTPSPGSHMNSDAMCEFYTHAHAQTELAGVAKKTADIVKSLPEYGQSKKMLDLGGGPGINSVAVVQSHPVMEAVVFDREGIVAVAREYIDRFGMADRIQTRAGDYRKDDLGRGYDLILVSDTLYYTGEELDRMASRLFNILNPGGVLVGIHGVLSQHRTKPCQMVLGMLPDALMDQGELPDSGFLAPALFRAGFASVHTRQVRMVSNEMEVDIARKEKE